MRAHPQVERRRRRRREVNVKQIEMESQPKVQTSWLGENQTQAWEFGR
jgi:hypothetical protein